MKIKEIILASLLGLALLASYGCEFLAGTAVGGAGGYILRIRATKYDLLSRKTRSLIRNITIRQDRFSYKLSKLEYS